MHQLFIISKNGQLKSISTVDPSSKVLTLGKAKKKSFSLAFRSFNRTVDPSSKVLTLGKAKKKKFFFGFSLV